jgi:hypothetical protein
MADDPKKDDSSTLKPEELDDVSGGFGPIDGKTFVPVDGFSPIDGKPLEPIDG